MNATLIATATNTELSQMVGDHFIERIRSVTDIVRIGDDFYRVTYPFKNAPGMRDEYSLDDSDGEEQLRVRVEHCRKQSPDVEKLVTEQIDFDINLLG